MKPLLAIMIVITPSQYDYFFREPAQRALTSWSRLAGQLCRLPNTLSNALPTAKKGCFIVKFSHDGRNLACACHGKEGYPILVYEVTLDSFLYYFQVNIHLHRLLGLLLKGRICSGSKFFPLRVAPKEKRGKYSMS